jgi:flagellar motility protein MotE (MotC chaperone)
LPVDLTDSEVNLLQSLAQRREELDRRVGQIELREGLLKAAEKRVDEKIAKLAEMQSTLQSLLKQFDAKTDAQLESLVKTYEAMKPKDAARIWDELEMPVLLQLVERMREMKTAPILSAMNPEVARKVTDELMRRRQLPGAAGLGKNG